MTTCPCGSGLKLSACCGRHHAGEPAPTAEKLMRSRYAAYALGKLDYIASTCAGPAALSFNRAEADKTQLGIKWTGLEIVATRKGRAKDTEGSVSFIARYSRNSQPDTLSEKSEFRRVNGVWHYWDGQTLDITPPRASNIGRNDPCPCGSGIKFKKCCGAAA